MLCRMIVRERAFGPCGGRAFGPLVGPSALRGAEREARRDYKIYNLKFVQKVHFLGIQKWRQNLDFPGSA
jgi:hypothetical protein